MGEAKWPSTWRDWCVPLCYASSSPSWPKSQEDWIGSITLSKLKTMMTTLETRIKTIADPIRIKLAPTMLVTTIKIHVLQGLIQLFVTILVCIGGTATYFLHIVNACC